MSTQPSDPEREAARVQVELLRSMGPTRRAQLMRALSRSVITMARRAIAVRNPGLDATGLRLAFIELHYGAALANQVRARLSAAKPSDGS